MARCSRPHNARLINTGTRLDHRSADLLPDPLDHPDQLQDGGTGYCNDPPLFFVLRLDAGKLRCRCMERSNYMPLPVELDHHRRRIHHSRHHHRGSGGLVDGLRALETDQGHPTLDALHQDAAGGWRALPDLPACSSSWACSTARFGLTIVIMLINLPIIVWMLYTYFKEIPGEILEAARMDGASIARGSALCSHSNGNSRDRVDACFSTSSSHGTKPSGHSTSTAAKAAPLTAFIASYSSPEGLFYAKLSAASTMAIAPILILGWFSQKQLVSGLTFGAVK